MELISHHLEIISRKMISESSCYVVGQKPHRKYKGRMKKCYRSDVEYAAFFGIPYAKKPESGLNRYQAPESASLPQPKRYLGMTINRETRTYEANHIRRRKVSTQMRAPHFEGSSDCLYLNIFLPKRPELIDKLQPVLVFIHGGGFTYGSNDPEMYTPDSIVQHGVVFVTINYRLGLFGFLNTRTKDCPGNAGLKDQVKALEWIRDNIECFKGDPNNVTISGCSAGATCVNLHLVVPASKDLFHKAIVQSGGIYCPWGYRGHRREQSRMLLSDSKFRRLLFKDKESKTLQKHACRLLEADRALRHPKSLAPYFGPSVEKFREGAFIPDDIQVMMEKVDHNKPVMAGITKAEGLHPFIVNVRGKFTECIDDDRKFHQLLMDNLRWSYQTTRKHLNEIRNKYFPNTLCNSEQDKERGCANLVRDIFFHRFYDNFKFGPEKRVHKNLYVYRFDHVSEISAVRRRNLRHHYYDATHGDELKYLYCPVALKRYFRKYIYRGRRQNREIEEVTNHMCSLWANFCKTGIPKSEFDSTNVEWRPHTENKPCYLRIERNLHLEEESLFESEWNWFNEGVYAEPTLESAASTPK